MTQSLFNETQVPAITLRTDADPDSQLFAFRTRSASGARYVNAAADLEFRDRGDEARLNLNRQQYDCQPEN